MNSQYSQSLSVDCKDDERFTLEEWLRECYYFDPSRKQELSMYNLNTVGTIIRGLMKFEPLARASPSEILRETWFEDTDTSLIFN